MLIIVLVVILLCAVIVSAVAPKAEYQAVRIETDAAERVIEADAEVSQLQVVKSVAGTCIARVPGHSLVSISVGDRIGRTHALVKEIVRGRVVLEETFIDGNGSPNFAEIIIRDGETGGTRYMRHPEEKRPIGVRPVAVDRPPAAEPQAK